MPNFPGVLEILHELSIPPGMHAQKPQGMSLMFLFASTIAKTLTVVESRSQLTIAASNSARAIPSVTFDNTCMLQNS